MNFESMPKPNQNKKESLTPEEQELIKGIDKTLSEKTDKIIELKPEQTVEPSIEERKDKTMERLKKGEVSPLPEKPKEERAKKIPEEVIKMFTDKNGKVDVEKMKIYLNENLYGIGAKPKENPGAERRL